MLALTHRAGLLPSLTIGLLALCGSFGCRWVADFPQHTADGALARDGADGTLARDGADTPWDLNGERLDGATRGDGTAGDGAPSDSSGEPSALLTDLAHDGPTTLPALPLPVALPPVDGWRWDLPLNFGDPLSAVWIQNGEVFVGSRVVSGGDAGLVLAAKAGDATWRIVGQTTAPIQSLWGRSSTELYAATLGGIVRFEGNTWQQLGPANRATNKLAGEPKGTRIFAAGALESYYTDGTSWAELALVGAATGVWCCEGPSAFFVGAQGVTGWDGANTTALMPSSAPLNAIWGRANGAAWAVGADGTIILHPGPNRHWEQVQSPTRAALNALVGYGPSETYVVGDKAFLRHDGSDWAAVTNPAIPADALWRDIAAEADQLVAVASNGRIAQLKGSVWRGGEPRRLSTTAIGALWTDDSQTLAVDADKGLLERVKGVWQKAGTSPFRQRINALWGSAPNRIYAVGAAGGIYLFDGARWQEQSIGDTSHTLNAVHGCSPTAVYAGGTGGLWSQTSEGAWSQVWSPPSSQTIQAVFCIEDTVFVGLAGGQVLGFKQGDFDLATLEVTVGPAVEDIWASSKRDVWVVRQEHKVHHFDGIRWQQLAPLGDETWYSTVWGRGPNEVYLGGPAGAIYRFDGSAFHRHLPLTAQTIRTIRGNATNIFAAGDNGMVLIHTR